MRRLWLVLTIAALGLMSLTGLAAAQKPGPEAGPETRTPTETLTPTFAGAWHGYILVQWTPEIVDNIRGRSAILGTPHPYCDIDLGCVPTAEPPIPPPLAETFALLAPEHGSWPPYLLQIRYNLEYTAAILEARFDVAPTIDNILNLLSQRALALPHDELRGLTVAIFAPSGTWAESRYACAVYLAAHQAEWGLPE
jgi:hypothetical protein